MLHVSLWHQLIRMFVFYHENSASNETVNTGSLLEKFGC